MGVARGRTAATSRTTTDHVTGEETPRQVAAFALQAHRPAPDRYERIPPRPPKPPRAEALEKIKKAAVDIRVGFAGDGCAVGAAS